MKLVAEHRESDSRLQPMPRSSGQCIARFLHHPHWLTAFSIQNMNDYKEDLKSWQILNLLENELNFGIKNFWALFRLFHFLTPFSDNDIL